MKRFLMLTLALALSMTLCTSALALEENGKPTADEFLTHWKLTVNVPGVEDTATSCEPFHLYFTDSNSEDGYATGGYQYSSYKAIEPDTTFTLTNVAPQGSGYMFIKLNTYEWKNGRYVLAEDLGDYTLFDEGFRLSVLSDDLYPVLIYPGETVTFDLKNIVNDGTSVTIGPNTLIQMKISGYYSEYDYTYWRKATYRIDEARVAELRGETNTPATPAGISAVASPAKVLLDGAAVNFDAYVIEQNNYIKLRDFAQLVSDSAKQFDVAWDGSKNAITLTGGKAYTSVGGEEKPGDGVDKTATLNTSALYLDGKSIDLKAYTINQNNYFKLRDLCRALDIYVGWDGATGTVSIDTAKAYVAEP